MPVHPNWTAIAAMAENRVIGDHGRIPWHLPEDFKFFRETTTGHLLVMGRVTFESIGRPLPGRHTLVLTSQRNPNLASEIPAHSVGAFTPKAGSGSFEFISSVSSLHRPDDPRRIFICGGSRIYAALLPDCAELLLTRVKRTVPGDAFFPLFEYLFDRAEILRDTPDFTIERWVRREGSD